MKLWMLIGVFRFFFNLEKEKVGIADLCRFHSKFPFHHYSLAVAYSPEYGLV